MTLISLHNTRHIFEVKSVVKPLTLYIFFPFAKFCLDAFIRNTFICALMLWHQSILTVSSLALSHASHQLNTTHITHSVFPTSETHSCQIPMWLSVICDSKTVAVAYWWVRTDLFQLVGWACTICTGSLAVRPDGFFFFTLMDPAHRAHAHKQSCSIFTVTYITEHAVSKRNFSFQLRQ